MLEKAKGFVSFREMPEHFLSVRSYTDDTAFQDAALSRVKLELVSLLGGLDVGRHRKAPACCPCSLLAALYGAPRMLLSLSAPLFLALCKLKIQLKPRSVMSPDFSIFQLS